MDTSVGKLFLKSKGMRNTTLGSGYRGLGRKPGAGMGEHTGGTDSISNF